MFLSGITVHDGEFIQNREKNRKRGNAASYISPFSFLCNMSSMSLYAFIKVSVMILSIDFYARSTLLMVCAMYQGQCTGYEDQFEPFSMVCLLQRKKPPFFFYSGGGILEKEKVRFRIRKKWWSLDENILYGALTLPLA